MTSLTETGPGRRALVVGTGLIGGSIALGLRRRGWHVSGIDADEARADDALAAGVVDALGDDLDAEVVFVAVPAAAVADEVRRILAVTERRPDAVVSDVSGVKTAIVEAADHPRFIGGHPMAGSEQIGLHGADPDLFEGAVWVLTPTAATDLESFDRLKGVVLSLGADLLVLSPADHDRLVAVVSHVPHLVAATLMNAASAGAEQDGALLRLAAGGFRDMTRVAAGHPGIWPDICAENAVPIVDALDALVTDLTAMRARIAAHDRRALLDALEKASAARRNLPARVVRPDHLAELRIPVPDRAGVLAEITSLAADAGIGIYDIEIAHSAEGPRGVLILVVDGADADTLAASVEAHGYRCRAAHLS
jgi:prephenate dehydrogenase